MKNQLIAWNLFRNCHSTRWEAEMTKREVPAGWIWNGIITGSPITMDPGMARVSVCLYLFIPPKQISRSRAQQNVEISSIGKELRSVLHFELKPLTPQFCSTLFFCRHRLAVSLFASCYFPNDRSNFHCVWV